ncbi:hypothetical protein [Irregularibacter muris]|uniref:hypothetical protein n=1 Tax=Irregularibacter muris TaxID=1796619 RepID=UPI0027D46FAA|nr:hypothetical protein [Irregularibacter muris]
MFIILKSRDEKWLEKEFLEMKDDKTSNFFSRLLSTYGSVKKLGERQTLYF